MNKILKQIIILATLIAILVLPYFVFAENKTAPLAELDKIQPTSGYAKVTDENTAPKMAGKIVNALFGFLGIIFIILMLMAGLNWMTAGGDEGKLTKAKDTIRRAIIGLIITVGSYAIAEFVVLKLLFD